MAGGDPARSARSPLPGPGNAAEFEVRFAAPTGLQSLAQPVVGGDGSVYLFTPIGAAIALGPSGSQRWLQQVGQMNTSTYNLVAPALSPTGDVLFVASSYW